MGKTIYEKIKFGKSQSTPLKNNTEISEWDYFCNQSCLMDFIRLHLTSIVAIAPRREALETPIKVVKEKYQNHRTEWNEQGSDYRQVPYMSTRTTIKSVDND